MICFCSEDLGIKVPHSFPVVMHVCVSHLRLMLEALVHLVQSSSMIAS